VDQVNDVASKMGMGGRLYKDARVKAGDDPEPTPEPKIDAQAPKIPKPWMVQPIEPEPIEKPKKERDWQQIQSTFLEVLGILLFAGGFGIWHLWVGVVVLGFCVIVLGVAAGLPEVPSIRKRKR
jgi:hypothetical protein